MALGDSYATLAALKSRMGITGTTDDTPLTEALSAASRGIERVCRRQFNKITTATARRYYPDRAVMVRVDDFHTETGLVVKTDDGDDGTYETTWVTTDYQTEPLNGTVDGETGWPFGRLRAVDGRTFPTGSRRASVEVTAQWGWTAVPAVIKEVCLMVAEETFKLKDAPYGVAGFSDFGPVRVGAGTANKAERMILPYRRLALLVGWG